MRDYKRDGNALQERLSSCRRTATTGKVAKKATTRRGPSKTCHGRLHALRAQQEAQTRASPVQSPAAKHAGTSRFFFSKSRFKKQNWSEHNRREAVGERLSERRSSPPDVLRMRRNALQRSGERSVNGGVAPSLSKAPSRPRPRTIKNFSYSERKRKIMPGPC